MHRIKLAALLAAVTLTGISTSAEAQSDRRKRRAAESYQEALSLMKRQEYGKAMGRLRSSVRNHPLPQYRAALCEAATRSRQWRDSVEYCKEAAEATRGTRYAAQVEKMNRLRLEERGKELMERAASERRRGNYDKAIEYYGLVADKIGRAEHWLVLCETQKDAGKNDDAARSCAKAAKLAKDPKVVARAQAGGSEAAEEPAQPTAEQAAHLDKVGNAAISARNINLARFQDRDRHKYESDAKTCVDVVAAAKKAGVVGGHWVWVNSDFDDTKQFRVNGQNRHYVRFRAVEVMCADKWQQVRALDAVLALDKAQSIVDRIGKGIDLNEATMVSIGGAVEPCRAGVDKALKLGLSPKLELPAGSRKVKLGAARAEVCDKLAAEVTRVQAEYKAKLEAERQAKLAPFRKVLEGGKMKVVEDWEMYEISVYGKGGYELESPAEFAKARLWFMVLGGEDDLGRPYWRLRRFQFRGNKLVKQSEKTGRGSEPPARAYR